MSSSFRRLPRCLLACLVSSCRLLPVPPLYSPGGTVRRWASALLDDCGVHTASVVRLLVPRFALRSVCLSPRPSTRVAGRGADVVREVVVACFFRVSPAVRGFYGSRSLWLPGLLRHGILFSCRRGRTSAIAAHRNSLACFSIPISAPLFASSPVFDAYSGHGYFQSFHARLLMGRSFRRAPPRPPA